MGQAGKKMRFWTNVGVTVGFLGFSLPWTMRKQIPMRFLKGMVAGTVGVFLFAPVRVPPSDLDAMRQQQSGIMDYWICFEG